jgi:hypothetical protein
MPPATSVRRADELTSIDSKGYGSGFLPDLISIGPTAGDSDTVESVLGESESRGRLTFVIAILITLGVLLKYLSSPAFYEVLSGVCSTVFDIEHQGRD